MSLKQGNANKKHGLGKGIGSLLDDYSIDAELYGALTSKSTKSDEATDSGERVLEVPIGQLMPNPNQPRKNFDQAALDDLALSIKNQGIISPIVVEKISDTSYSIVAGERRYRAAKQAGLAKVPVIVRSFSEAQRLEVALIENIQRENLNAIEEAKAYAYLLDETGITQEELARKVGKNRSTITNSLRLLSLTKEQQDDLLSGKLNAGQARALLSVVNPADRTKLYETLKKKELSVRATERMAAAFNEGKRAAFQRKKRGSKDLDDSPAIVQIKDRLLHALGKQVDVKGDEHKGKLVIPYETEEELEQICDLLAHEEED